MSNWGATLIGAGIGSLLAFLLTLLRDRIEIKHRMKEECFRKFYLPFKLYIAKHYMDAIPFTKQSSEEASKFINTFIELIHYADVDTQSKFYFFVQEYNETLKSLFDTISKDPVPEETYKINEMFIDLKLTIHIGYKKVSSKLSLPEQRFYEFYGF